MSFITIIGRGHSGTRAMSHTLSASCVFMGEPLNHTGDLLPPESMYEACRVMAKYVRHLGGLRWDFQSLRTMPIDPAFTRLVESYLSCVLNSDSEHKGWKLPETTLVYPWIIRLYPEIRYIYWIRDPRDCILSGHKTDDLVDFGIYYDSTENIYQRRAISWRYQTEIIKATPPPAHFTTVRFEDFVLDQAHTLQKLEDFLGLPLETIEVRPEAVGRWKTQDIHCDAAIFKNELIEHSYV